MDDMDETSALLLVSPSSEHTAINDDDNNNNNDGNGTARDPAGVKPLLAAIRTQESVDGRRIGSLAAVLSLVRASIGPGALALPYAFSKSGIAVGLALLVTLATTILYNMFTLVALKRQLPGAQTYGDVGHAVLGRRGRALVEVSLMGMELGICTVYFSYISTNLGAVVEGFDNTNGRRTLTLALLPVLGLLGQITSMKAVALLSSCANVAMAAALIIVWYYLCLSVAQHGIQRGAWGTHNGWQEEESDKVDLQWLLTLATIIYSFEGCGAVIPLENASKEPKKFGLVLGAYANVFFNVQMLS
jgi:proton-coupled amino acid transporter